ncbi:hypothetical protein ER308_16050 [Egibacter rhizosphaerae]|uniref:Peptidoglycan recognition protein family domain-containing protein n=1 Tax=Egibacter rhizosphaerae TaxID=1670831 RepID=A0A411YIB5_9ACTN|nr:cell wall-binding repeat-containing protein [Egibacter rhizosphaerae]QBI20937.1 hypothetical protein ER308_16050 [Egibacter rhizosphaerae]
MPRGSVQRRDVLAGMAAGAALVGLRPRIALADNGTRHEVMTPSAVAARARRDLGPGTVHTDSPFRVVGFRLPRGAKHVRVRTSSDGETWTDWRTLRPAGDAGEAPDREAGEDTPETARVTEPLSVPRSEWIEVRDVELEDLEIHLVDDTGEDVPVRPRAAGDEPSIISRSQWGAPSSTSPASRLTRARSVIVHHTATNGDYSPSEVNAIVRSFHRYHTQSLGWSDIGYQYLVDKFGNIYEGRGGHAAGAHVRGFNSETVGISLIGDFNGRSATEDSWRALAEAAGWQCAVHRIDPRGDLALLSRGGDRFVSGAQAPGPAVRGHTDLGSTSCPGSQVHSRLDDLRERVIEDAESRASAAQLGQAARPSNELDSTVERIDSRAPTAVGLAAAAHAWAHTPTLVIASGDDFADALCGGALAAAEDAPLLLVPEGGPSNWLKGEILGLGAERVLVLGGSAAIDEGADADFGEHGATVERIYGADRFETAVEIARRIGAPTGEVAICLGRHEEFDRAWPDALSAAALAAAPRPVPTLLAREDRVPDATLDALEELDVSTAILIGGEAALQASVEEELAGAGVSTTRLAGEDRYGTSRAVLLEALSRFDGGDGSVVAAPGRSYPEAVVAGALAAHEGAGVLLVPSHDLEDESSEVLGDVDRGFLVADPSEVSEQVREQLVEFIE